MGEQSPQEVLGCDTVAKARAEHICNMATGDASAWTFAFHTQGSRDHWEFSEADVQDASQGIFFKWARRKSVGGLPASGQEEVHKDAHRLLTGLESSNCHIAFLH